MHDIDVPKAFSLLVLSYLEKRGMTAGAFAKKVGTHQTYMSRILAAKRPPPENLDIWADALELEGDERDRFLEEGYLIRTPPHIVALVERLRKALRKAR